MAAAACQPQNIEEKNMKLSLIMLCGCSKSWSLEISEKNTMHALQKKMYLPADQLHRHLPLINCLRPSQLI